MGAWAFLLSMLGSAVALLLPALLAGITIAFFIPARPAKLARLFAEWATALSGAGYVSMALVWMAVTYADLPSERLTPQVFGSAVAVAYLPLCIVLCLRALEPQWPVLVAGRSLGLSAWQVSAAVIRSASAELRDVLGLFAARLLSDGATLLCVIWASATATLISLPMMAASIVLLARRLPKLACTSGVPAYPPLFGPLPELPPRLRMAPRISTLGQIALQLSLASLIAVAAMEVSGLGILRSWAVAQTLVQPAAQHYQHALTAIGIAMQSAIPILALATLLIWVWLKYARHGAGYNVSITLAAISPLAFSYPVVLLINVNWFIWLMVAATSLALYIAIQINAGQSAHTLAYRNTLIPGDNTPAAATRALGLPPSGQAYWKHATGEALSAAAVWFSAAALLAVAYGDGSSFAAYALIWGALAGFLQLGAVWQRNSQPRSHVCNSPVSATMEALAHDPA